MNVTLTDQLALWKNSNQAFHLHQQIKDVAGGSARMGHVAGAGRDSKIDKIEPRSPKLPARVLLSVVSSGRGLASVQRA